MCSKFSDDSYLNFLSGMHTLATNNQEDENIIYIGNYDIVELAKDTYHALSDEAKVLAATTVSAAVALAANWNSIYGKWNQIAFRTTFANSIANVTTAFDTIRSDLDTEMEKNPVGSIPGNVVTMNGVRYNCTVNFIVGI